MSIIISNNVQVGQSGTANNNITLNTSASGDLVVNKGVWPNITEITRVSNTGLVDGSKVSFTPTGTISATTVQAAIAELSTELTATSDASGITYTPNGTGAVATTVQSKLRESVSVFGFMTEGQIAIIQAYSYAEDVSLAINAAISSAYVLKKGLHFPSGGYLANSLSVMGNTAETCGVYCKFTGDGNNTIIKVTAVNQTAFSWQGPNPDVDGGGNRIDGRIVIEKMHLIGPSSANTNTNSIGLKFYGAQGITLRDVTLNGWRDSEYYQNCDIVSRYNVTNQSNFNGINTAATGYALAGEGQLNSFNTYGGLIANNSGHGVYYIGGIAPCFFGTNFVLNGISLAFSVHVGSSVTTASPLISGCYFEDDIGTTILLGGGNGVVRDAIIDGGFIICGSATAAITVANYVDAFARGRCTIAVDTGHPGSSRIIQGSAQKIDDLSINGTPIGNVTPSTGRFYDVRTGDIAKVAVAPAGTAEIFFISTPGAVVSLALTITSQSVGLATAKKYSVTLMGAGNAAASAITVLSEDAYSGGASAFTLTELQNSPVFGTNKLVITNTSGVTCNFFGGYTIEYSNGVYGAI